MVGVFAAILVLSACGGASALFSRSKGAVPPAPSLFGVPLAALQGKLTGLLPPNTTLQLDIGLPIDRQGLAQVAQDVYNPASASYGHYLTPPQIATRFGASTETIQQVSKWLTSQGFQIVNTSLLHTNLVVRADVSHIARAFHTPLGTYSLDGRAFFGPSAAPTLPAAIAPLISSVTGLSDFTHAMHTPVPPVSGGVSAIPETVQRPDVGDCTLYGVLGGFTRDKIAHAYALDQLYKQGFQGQGMKVGVVELGDPYSRADVANYALCNGDQLHLRNVEVDNPLPAGTGAGEATLDLEMIAGLAPDAQILDYQTPQSDNIGFLDVLNKIATDDQVQVVSVSYGAGEDQFDLPYMTQFNDLLELLAVEGISVFIASGDCAAYTDGVFGQLMVSFPASAPWAIGVGGTSFQGSSEIAWSQPNPDHTRCQNTWGTGGGVSKNKNFVRPLWQTGPGVQNQYSNSNRQVPDVAAIADNISVYYQGFWQPVGGTSASAPMWAAGAVVLDQALQKKGKPLLGGVPALYTVANHPGSLHPFHDITRGNNLFYQAGPGWDYTTGLGTPNFLDIADLLEAA